METTTLEGKILATVTALIIAAVLVLLSMFVSHYVMPSFFDCNHGHENQCPQAPNKHQAR